MAQRRWRVSQAQCSMSSACRTVDLRASECAAHDALQTRDHTELKLWTGPRLRRSRISIAPLRACVALRLMEVYVCALALRCIRDTGALC
jgi:hypothetical protein